MTTALRMRRTSSRARVLDFIEAYIEDHGYGPSIRDIAAGVGLASVSSAEYHLHQLEAEGCITRAPKVPRSIRLVTP